MRGHQRPDDEGSPGGVIEVERPDDEGSPGGVTEVERPDDEGSPGGVIEVERPDDEGSPGGVIEMERPDDEGSPGGVIEMERPDDEGSPGGVIEVERPDDEGSPGGVIEVERPDDEGSPDPEEVLGEHLDKKEAAEMKSEEVQHPLSKANETKPETDGSSGGNRETTKDSTWLWILWLIWTTVRSFLPFKGQQSVLPVPDQLTVDSVDTTSAAVSWNQPPGLDQTQHHYQISYYCPGTEPYITTTYSHSITLSDLKPATQYSVTVCTVLENGKQSQLVSTTLITILPAPDQLTVDSVNTTSAAVSWNQPPGLNQTQHHYQISYHCPGTEPHITTTSSHSITLPDLQCGTQYSVTVCTVLENGKQSQLGSTTLTTEW
ncbi:putative receptor-type tyrosine-protein phosphatase mosPTP-1 [Salvelinus alpinus]|uniref:putative receptor-type tyrosine-protein phosphatase mosPTP-1 n=1 Tax=Salvelinus alpinus TaxID=8036 RepID=UPI0039FC543B